MYKKDLRQKEDDNKSYFISAANASANRINGIMQVSGFIDKDFPFNYLDCPIYQGREIISLFDGLLSKIIKRSSGWQGKMLYYGDKLILIKHVFQSILIYTMSILNPPKGTINLIEKNFSNFCWGSFEGNKNYHWSS